MHLRGYFYPSLCLFLSMTSPLFLSVPLQILSRSHSFYLSYFYDGSAFLIFLSVNYLSPSLITSFFLFLSSSLSFYTFCFSKFHVPMTSQSIFCCEIPYIPSLCLLQRRHHLLFHRPNSSSSAPQHIIFSSC